MSLRVGKYVLGERLGVGGMAEVWRATVEGPHGFRKEVALKRVHPHHGANEEFTAMFIDEARIAARLQHANIVQVIDFDEVDGRLYLAMELIKGCDLRRILDFAARQKKPLQIAHACFIVGEILKALHYAHGLSVDGIALQLVHRDVTPHNVLVSVAGEVKLSDFGIAKAASKLSQTTMGRVKGKISYMSPEQIRGESADVRADVFSLGATAYELFTGTKLYDAETEGELIGKVMAASFVPPRERNRALDHDLETVLLRMLSPRREDRYPSAGEALAELRACGDYASDALGLAGYLAELLPATVGRPEMPPDAAATHFEPVAAQWTTRTAAAAVVVREGENHQATTLTASSGEVRSDSPRPRPRVRGWIAACGAASLVVAGLVGYLRMQPRLQPRAVTVALSPARPREGIRRLVAPIVEVREMPPEPMPSPMPTPLPEAVMPDAVTAVASEEAAPAPLLPRRKRKEKMSLPVSNAQSTIQIVVIPWADVRIDGNAPVRAPTTVEVSAGVHRLHIENRELGRSEVVELDARPSTREAIWRDWLK